MALLRSAAAPGAPDPFELAARRFERKGALVYLRDPVGFARDCILWPPGEGLTPYQADVLDTLQCEKRLAVRGPHGLGKTTTNSIAVLWFATTREAARIDWKVPTTAGSWHQLQAYLWPEIHKWAARLDWAHLQVDPWRPEKELLTQSIKLRYGQAFAASPTDAKLIEGAHADEILFVFDESKAIAPSIFDAAEGALSGDGEALALAQSTPGEPQGRFYEIHQQRPGLDDWAIRHVTKIEVVAAGRMSEKWAQNRMEQWGFDSPVYQNRVEGNFFSSSEDTVIPLSWIEAAVSRWHEWNDSGRPEQEGRNVHGVDVARGGTDLTAVAMRTGSVVRTLRTYNFADTTKVADRVRSRMLLGSDLAVVDTIGVGAGVVDLMRRWKLRVHAFNASRKTKRRDRNGDYGFRNQRSAMWWLAREMLDPAFEPTLALPPHTEMTAEMSTPKWRVGAGGRIEVESKDDIRKRLGRSTDHADAVLQTLLTDAEWNEPPKSDGPDIFAYTDRRGVDDGVYNFG